MKYLMHIMMGVFLIGLYSCNFDSYLENVQKGLNATPSFKSGIYSYVVIIPNTGCSGCISEAVSFFRNNKDDNIFFIFTNIFSKKDFYLNMGNSIKNKENVFIDINNEFLCEDESINAYPIVIDIRDINYMSWKYLDSGEDLETLFRESDLGE